MALTDSFSVSIPANSTVNAFLGRPSEFMGAASIMRLLVAADAAGVQVQMLINVGGVQSAPIAAGSTVNVASAAGAGPKDDEDTIGPAIPLPAGSRSQLNFSNTTAATVVARYRALIVP